MATVKEMRTRIGSVKSTQKITKALQMVAAAKLRRAQQAAEAARPYARGMANVIANLAAGVSGPRSTPSCSAANASWSATSSISRLNERPRRRRTRLITSDSR